jgi:hypothetical protein
MGALRISAPFFCRPSHALYFASYEAAKNFYTGNQGGHQPVSVAAAGKTHCLTAALVLACRRNEIINISKFT